METENQIIPQFRFATEEDVLAIVNLCNECFFEETVYEHALEVFQKTIHDENQLYLIGTWNGEIVAHTRISIVSTMFKGMDTYAILNHVCVKPIYRKHAIATKMLNEVVRICQERGCTTIKLWSNNFRIPAHACYRKFGFESLDTTFFVKEI